MMNIYSLGKDLTSSQKKDLKNQYPFVKWGHFSDETTHHEYTFFLEVDIHNNMIEALNFEIIDLLLKQNAKSHLEIIIIRFQTVDILTHSQLLKYMQLLQKKISKQKLSLWIYPKEDQPYPLFLKLFKHTKATHISLVFDPTFVKINKGSVLSQYKALSKYIGCVVAHDISTKYDPELIGYGQADLIKLFKLMIKNNYKGDILCQPEYSKYIERLHKKSQGVFRFLRQKELKSYQLIKERLKIDEKKDVELIDIYQNQLDVLSIIFNLS
jgi:hypothetical protein